MKWGIKRLPSKHSGACSSCSNVFQRDGLTGEHRYGQIRDKEGLTSGSMTESPAMQELRV